jgi:predicted negative regulator of RcsB-dependent stress response
MNKSIHYAVLTGILFCAYPFRMKAQYSQLDLPRESQAGTVTQRIGITDITVNYSRPSVKGRTVWGDIVPYDQVWRVGANENTVFTTTHDITVEGQTLPAGTYGVHAIPTTGKWTIIFSKDNTAWGSFFYKKENDALRVDVTPRACTMTEQVTYDFADVAKDGATLTLRWEKMEVPVKLGVDVHGIVLAEMDAQLRGLGAFAWEVWYEAAHYCHQEKIAPEKAMKWVEASIARQPNFENQTLKATMLEEQGKTAEAAALRKTMIDGATNAQLNTYAYQLANQGKLDEAIRMFELNAKRHADDPNVHDSLGEGYMMAGNKEAAIKAFKKSLSMNPPEGVKANSLKCLKKLGVDTSAWEGTKS